VEYSFGVVIIVGDGIEFILAEIIGLTRYSRDWTE